MTPSFGWSAYLNAIGLAPPGEVNVTEPAFFQEVEKLLKGRGTADWRVYLRWHLAHQEAAYLSAAFVKANFDFYSKYLRGVAEMQPRWKRCVRLVDRDLGEALGQVFVAKTFQGDTKANALAMTREIEKAMEADLARLAWMGEETRKQALVKLHGVVNKIGYPDQWRDYSSLRVAPGDFAGNADRAVEFESKRQLNKIGKPVDRKEWDITPPTVDAYYNPQMNDINFPAGVLQPPLFDPKMDDAPNYGNTGATIGHELTYVRHIGTTGQEAYPTTLKCFSICRGGRGSRRPPPIPIPRCRWPGTLRAGRARLNAPATRPAAVAASSSRTS